jgi:hypothetical protein
MGNVAETAVMTALQPELSVGSVGCLGWDWKSSAVGRESLEWRECRLCEVFWGYCWLGESFWGGVRQDLGSEATGVRLGLFSFPGNFVRMPA